MRTRIAHAVAVLAAVLAGAALALAVTALAGSRPALAGTNPSGALSIAIDGNHFVNGSGQTIRLLGVDRPGTEYACQEGWADSDGDDTAAAAAADAAAIAAWHANAVRIPLNEDCWLGINDEPSYGTVSGYQQVVERFVADLNADGIYAILDLHWSAPGTTVADGQRPMPDDHSAAFWTSVADTFKTDPAVLFDAFNEPYSPAADYPDAASYPVSWSCWQRRRLHVAGDVDGTDPGSHPATYTAVGMQTLVDAIRATGASQPILLGGLAYANDLSGWLAHEPTDPDHQLAASFHNYEGEACSTMSCWNDRDRARRRAGPSRHRRIRREPVSSRRRRLRSGATWTGPTRSASAIWPGAGLSRWLATTNWSMHRTLPVAPNGTAVHDHLAALAAGEHHRPPQPPPPPRRAASTSTPTTSTSTPSTPSATATTTPPVTAPPATTTTATHRRPPARCVVPAADRRPSHPRPAVALRRHTAGRADSPDRAGRARSSSPSIPGLARAAVSACPWR